MHPFGRELLSEWMIDPSITYLNHGTVGAPPRRVLAAQRAIQDEIERQPATFLLRELADTGSHQVGGRVRMREAAAAVASFVGADVDDTVFVDNATTGANAVLRSFPWQAGDEVLVTDLGYGGVTNAVAYAARVAGATVRSIEMPSPGADASAFVDAIEAALGPWTRMLVVDHISATTALVLPVRAITDLCHARGVQVLVDGAHAPGAIDLDIPALGADWYVANLHKWCWTPRSAGIAWIAPEHHRSVHAAVISWGLDHGIAAEFDLPGTRDPSPFLAAPAAIDLMREWGVERIRAWNHDLAWWAGRYLSDRWGVAFTTPEAMIGTMVCVTLPIAADTVEPAQLQADLLADHGVEVPVSTRSGRLTLRVSTQVYNDRADIERLGDAVERLARRRSGAATG